MFWCYHSLFSSSLLYFDLYAHLIFPVSSGTYKTLRAFDLIQSLSNDKTLGVLHHHRTLSETNSYKYMGVQSDQNLKIQHHTTQTYRNACSRLQLLKRLRLKLTTNATVTIYQSIIFPLVTYCSLVTYSSKSYMKKANSLHSCADQIIGNNVKERFLEPIDSAMKQYLCKHVFKILIGENFPFAWEFLFCCETFSFPTWFAP